MVAAEVFFQIEIAQQVQVASCCSCRHMMLGPWQTRVLTLLSAMAERWATSAIAPAQIVRN